MGKREKLAGEAVSAFLTAHAGWELRGDALVRTFTFDSYAAGIAFVVELGFEAERRDHHPDLHVGYRRVEVVWTTHDAGGITALDTELCERSEQLARRR